MTLTTTLELREAQAALGQLSDEDLALMLRIRHFEQALLDLFSRGKLSGTTHTCLGQEYVPVAMRSLLRPSDYVFSHHRGHGHYLARFEEPTGLLAEIMGREGAVCGGVGGSQHIYRDRFLSSGVQGESMPVAAGVALHLRRAGQGDLAAVYIGDGTWSAGGVYEALNIAKLWHLPLVVLTENNHIALSTPVECELAGTIVGRARAFGAAYARVATKDVCAIRAQLAPLIDAVRRDSQPLVVEFETDRLGPHSKGDDTRPAHELEALRERDWTAAYAEQFPAQFAALDAQECERIAQAVRDVESRGPSAWRQA